LICIVNIMGPRDSRMGSDDGNVDDA